MVPEKSSQPSLVVGIGASAGGLAPLKAFVRALPEDTDMAFVVVQHLDPTHKSLLPELLQNACRLKVAEVHDEDEMLAGHVYVMPQDTYLEVEHNRLRLVESEDTRGTRKAIDYFFRSLAAEFGDRCAGIVFSGAGGDGTAGLRAIKAAGGLSLAQDPEEAEHRSMPETALRANAVDKVAPVSELPALLSQFADHPLTFLGDVRDNKPSEADDPGKSLMEIASILRTNENFDLRQYKASTVQRRIARRMSLTGQGAYADYLDLLRDSPQERNQLTQDLLINVTDFFRDREAFDLLRKEVFPKIVDNLDGDEPLRLWVAGCASGEEAYSLGILGLEAMAAARKKNDIRIFATDIDEHAIRIARRGFYPDSIAREVPGEYLETYFNKSENDHYYKVRGFLRDLISFAHQNVATDPPFNHMHLISCRNLLIYLKREAQEQILNSFYFALDGPSYLFLGSSESLGNRGELFRTVSKKWRIYQKIPHRDIRRDIKRRMRVDVAENLEDYQTAADADDSVDQHERAPAAGRRRNREMTRADQIRLAVMEAATPPCVVVDEQGQILFSHGDVRPFMVIPQGEPSTEVTQYLLPSMRSRIRSGLFKVRKNQQRGTVHCAMDEGADETTKRMVRVELVPMPRQDFVDGLAVSIVFHEAGRTDTPDISYTPDEDARAYADLEQELAETREELQNTLEELDTSTEELKASHEEALSTN
ncbi:MAG: chemotaxis protein CheB [Opitutales bacterium]